MSSREQILGRVKNNQPSLVQLPELTRFEDSVSLKEVLIDTFKQVAANVGSQVMEVKSYGDVCNYVDQIITPSLRAVTSIPELFAVAEDCSLLADMPPQSLENVELAVLHAEFGVAENSAIWITEHQMGIRVLPFIAQHLALVIDAKDIVADMHAAYARIGNSNHGFGTFIAGPSKTADIEQSLVLGAHGPRSLVIIIVQQ